ncbi:GDSL-type esterase/lipase family protein [Ferruginibacter paludis]|uniref:SGNH/GDSL hydrolase family protein n=1 Tax=Ferruginibacter paludis TaxID=1310417 RepID=UPI0025B4F1DC|nr:SGNH/GDSL hydrolase family protein [Ferruginibacter paludis]MDN3658732.1 GDSL-type esterase/lipase family protein [Ferruginibacter paludis]
MKFHFKRVAAGVCILFLTVTAFTIHKDIPTELPATALFPYGRCLINKEHNLELISSAVHFGFSFEGKDCQVVASIANTQDRNYLQYELDGVYQKRIKVSKNSHVPLVISAGEDGKHIVWIYKATEAHTGAIIIEKIIGQSVKAIKPKSAPLIEFIGNSITCGAAADTSEVPCGTGEYHDQHNAYYAYGPRVARELKTNFILSSVSGIGIYRNWNSDAPVMPQVYEKADFQESSSAMWDFKLYTPRIVSIALGTNDFSNGDGLKKRLPFDSGIFVSSYIQFVQLVKSKYPVAQIALLSSAMVNGSNRILLQNCLLAVQKNIDELYPADKKVAVFFFEPMQATGCGGHPSVAEHAILAEELIPFFRKLLKG